MGYERYPRDTDPRAYGQRRDRQDHGDGRERGLNDFRDYDAAGESGDRYTGQGQRDFYGQRDDGQRGYGDREYGNQRYAQRETQNANHGGYGYRGDYQRREEQRDRADGFTQPPSYRGNPNGDPRGYDNVGGRNQGDGGRRPQSYDYEERGFIQRAGDEVRSWFGDDEADRRRELDARYDGRSDSSDRQGQHRDSDYHSWRSGQIEALDRDYHEYRQENRSRFDNEFANWRTARQGQRDSLSKVQEHQDVLGSDGEHVGTVDKVSGDRFLLTKSDADAGGRPHSIPSRWIETVDMRGVTLSKTAAEAKQQWQDEECSQALFGDRSENGQDQPTTNRAGATTY